MTGHFTSRFEKYLLQCQQALAPAGHIVSGPFLGHPAYLCSCGKAWTGGKHDSLREEMQAAVNPRKLKEPDLWLHRPL